MRTSAARRYVIEPNPRYFATWPDQLPKDDQLRRASYRPSEIATMHGIGKSTVYEALYRGELKGHRIGRKGRAWIVPVEEVERWLSSGTASRET